MKSMLPPTPVRMPSELPLGAISPAGNGLSSDASGTALSAADCAIAVERVKPIVPWLCCVYCQGA